MNKAGSEQTKESKSYIDIQNFVWLPYSWHTQQMCECIIVCCVYNLSYPVRFL